MNEAISMWSGETVCSKPPSSGSPWTVMTFEPMPSIAAPIFTSMRARSWTCGSEAALRITVVPSISAAAISAFSVAMTDGSSMKKSTRLAGRSRASMWMSRPCSTVAPRARKASRCGSRRRRPITSPPGGGMTVRPKRVSSGPAARNDARMRSARPASTSVFVTFVGLQRDGVLGAAVHAHAEVGEQVEHRLHVPDARDVVQHDLLVREEAACQQRQRRVLVPGGDDRSGQGRPALDDELLHGAANLTAVPEPLNREQAWDLVQEWTASESLRRHMLAVEAAMRAYARKFGEDEEQWGLVGLLHDLDYERHPDLETGHPRVALAEFEERGFSPEFVRAVASHADFLGVSRDSRLEKTLFAVDELCGFVMACAYVRPQGIHGMTPKSVKKKMKTPAFAAAVNRDELREGA